MENFKWIVVMGVEEYRQDLNEIFLESGVSVFSELEVKGFRFTHSQLAGDAAPINNLEPIYSVVSFAMIQENQAKKVLSLISEFNRSLEKPRLLHAFQVNIEAVA